MRASMTPSVKPVPDGYHTATPALTVDNGAKALEFYLKAFSATKRNVAMTPEGKMLHGEFQIGDSVFMIADEFPGMGNRSPKSLGGSSFGIWLYVADVDGLYRQALTAGAVSVSPPTDMFWGDRFATVRDPFGHVWSIATHREDVPPAEMERRSKEFYAQMASRRT
ncbi:MAG TPA: VOC family protein [Thermoplasmata archaeon]|nr:VOC family protein [Thermoplasmata archaeon]